MSEARRYLKVRAHTLQSDLDEIEAGLYDEAYCNESFGFRGEDLTVVAQRRGVRRLVAVLGRYTPQIAAALSRMTWLTHLHVNPGVGGVVLDLRQHDLLQELTFEWSKGTLLPTGQSLKRLRIWKYSPPARDANELRRYAHLETLELVQANLTSLDGLPDSLADLELHYLRNLVDVSALGMLPDLASLQLDHCRSAAPGIVEVAPRMVKLERLALRNSGAIPTLAFIGRMPGLRAYNGYGTEVLDGHLTPLLRLSSANIKDKKGYSHKRKDLPGYVPEV